jgi:ribosomal protein S18 acetylase RimI-like enzyme
MMNKYSISLANPKDVPEILSVRRITWLATYPNEKYGITFNDIKDNLDKRDIGAVETWQKRIIEDKTSQTWTAKFQNKVIGFISASKGEKNNCIRALYVLPDFQHYGVGKLLMDAALKWLGNRSKITLEVVSYNANAIGFYQKSGFSENGPTICEVGNLPSGKHLPEIEMVKNPK